MKKEYLSQNTNKSVNKKWGTKNGVYYFLGNIPSHTSHALPVYNKIGGTFIVLSRAAYDYCVSLGLSVVLIDDRPDLFLEFSPDDILQTLKFIDKNAKVLVFYDIFSISVYITVPQIMLTHGNSFKDYYVNWRQKILPNYRWIAGLGPNSEQRLLSSGASVGQVLHVGLATSDKIIENAGKIVKRRFVAKRLGLDPCKPIISYMPTWWGPSSVNDVGLDIVRCISEDYSIIFRPHPSTPDDVISKYEEIITTEKLNAIYMPSGSCDGVDLSSIYSASSLFIGDMSSVMIDALLTDKPIIFAFGDGDRAQNESVYTPIKEVFNQSKKVTSLNVDNINQMVTDSLEKPISRDVYKKSRQRIFYDNISNNVELIVDAIDGCLTNQ
jgi:hypothetical protein